MQKDVEGPRAGASTTDTKRVRGESMTAASLGRLACLDAELLNLIVDLLAQPSACALERTSRGLLYAVRLGRTQLIIPTSSGKYGGQIWSAEGLGLLLRRYPMTSRMDVSNADVDIVDTLLDNLALHSDPYFALKKMRVPKETSIAAIVEVEDACGMEIDPPLTRGERILMCLGHAVLDWSDERRTVLLKVYSEDVMPLQKRERVVAYICDICGEYNFSPLTSYNAVIYFDRYMATRGVRPIERDEAELIALTCVLISAKFIERRVPMIDSLYETAAKKHPRTDFIAAEMLTLDMLEWQLHVSTPPALFKDTVPPEVGFGSSSDLRVR